MLEKLNTAVDAALKPLQAAMESGDGDKQSLAEVEPKSHVKYLLRSEFKSKC